MLSSSIAFDSVCVPERSSCICSFYDQVYIGTSNGHVRLIRGNGDMVQHVIPGNRFISCVEVLGEIGLLFVVCAGAIEVLDAQLMRPRVECKIQIKGEVLHVFTNRGSNPTFGLGVATALKVMLYRWNGEKHEVSRTISTLSIPRDIAWSGNTICMSTEQSISLIDVVTQTKATVHEYPNAPKLKKSSRRRSLERGSPILPGKFCLALADGRFIMVLDALGIIIDSKGTPSGNTLVWSSRPLCGVCISGFVVTLHDDGSLVEVHMSDSLDQNGSSLFEKHVMPRRGSRIVAPAPWNAVPSKRASSIESGMTKTEALLSGSRLVANYEDLSAGGGILVMGGSPPAVSKLGTISPCEQFNKLLEADDFAGAFSLFETRVLEKQDGAQLGSTEELTAQFYVDAGVKILRYGRINRAFEVFKKPKLDVRELLVYYAGLLRDDTAQYVVRKLVLDLPLPARTSSLEFCSTKDEAEKLMSSCSLLKLLTEQDSDKGLLLHRAILDYLIYMRSDEKGQSEEERRIRDEALLRGLVTLIVFEGEENTRRLCELCQGPSNLDVELWAPKLLNVGLSHCAALLYGSAEKTRRQALELWADMGRVKETVEFLRSHQQDPELVFVFSSWVLDTDPEQGVEIFTTPTLDVDRVLLHLEKHDKNMRHKLRLRYLEYLAQGSRENDLVLALEYINVMSGGDMSVRPEFARFCGTPGALQKSEAESIILRIDSIDSLSNALTSEKVDLYGKCGLHDRALKILVEDQGDVGAAETYCLKVIDEMEDGSDQDPFLDLLCIFFDPKHESRYRSASIAILERHGHHIDPTKVIAKLPADLSLADIEGYLSLIFVRDAQRSAHLRIEKNICAAQNIKVRHSLMLKHKRHTVVTADTRCGLCREQILTEPFAFQASSNDVVHCRCFQRQEN